MKPADNLVQILRANVHNPMALMNYLSELSAGISDIVNRLEVVENKLTPHLLSPTVGSKVPPGAQS